LDILTSRKHIPEEGGASAKALSQTVLGEFKKQKESQCGWNVGRKKGGKKASSRCNPAGHIGRDYELQCHPNDSGNTREDLTQGSDMGLLPFKGSSGYCVQND
jgi:hypothetical protein